MFVVAVSDGKTKATNHTDRGDVTVFLLCRKQTKEEDAIPYRLHDELEKDFKQRLGTFFLFGLPQELLEAWEVILLIQHCHARSILSKKTVTSEYCFSKKEMKWRKIGR